MRKNSQVFREINLYISDRMKNNLLRVKKKKKKPNKHEENKNSGIILSPCKDQFACKKQLTPLGK